MPFLRVLKVSAKLGLIQNLVNDWANLYSMGANNRGAYTRGIAVDDNVDASVTPRYSRPGFPD